MYPRVNLTSLPYEANSEPLFLRLSQLPNCVWLDSGKPASGLGRYDIITALPSATIPDNSPDLPQQLQDRLAHCQMGTDLPFCGGWIGYMAYEGNHRAMRLQPSGKEYGLVPQSWFGWYDWALVVDHKMCSTQLVFRDECDPKTRALVWQALQTEIAPDLAFECTAFTADESREHYLRSLEKIRAYLLAGDTYQVNYTQRFSAAFQGSAQGAYLALRRTVPSPFSAFLGLDQGTILSISPERFIQVRGRQALTQPIKGTVPRGKTPQEDEALRTELRESIKNRAENVMIVDLLRNDFSKHCKPFSVRVPELFGMQSFANVHHLVSSITGELEPGVQHPEFIMSCFPGGSITGAPKKRAMEIIDELEAHSRSVYCGAVGYFSCNGDTDFNIAIRTLVQSGKSLYAWAGGGIVVDSDPEQEYAESLFKIEALLAALSRRSN
jgi:para-aminobenzoate synthetase component 1